MKRDKGFETVTESKKNGRKDFWRLGRLLLAAGIFFCFFSIQIVPSASMNPTIQPKDMVLYKKTKKVERGDVVLFRQAEDKGTKYVKRVVGIEGDKIQLIDGEVFLNGKVLSEPYLLNNMTSKTSTEEIIVPKNSFYVLGDNRGNSEDSRHFDFVEKEMIIGKGSLILLPFQRFETKPFH